MSGARQPKRNFKIGFYPFRGGPADNPARGLNCLHGNRHNIFFRQQEPVRQPVQRAFVRSEKSHPVQETRLLRNARNYQASDEEKIMQQYWFKTRSGNFVLGLERMAEQIEEDTARGIVYPPKK